MRSRSLRRRPPSALAIGVAIAALHGCADTNVIAPDCIGTIDLELSADPVVVGETFTATAEHRAEACLIDLDWMTTGPISLAEAQNRSATFTADAVGSGTITVRNRDGQIGVIGVDVEEAEEGRPPR